jgi:lysozyme
MASKRKKKSTRLILVITIVAFALFAGMLGYKWMMYRKAKFTRYTEFGISIPSDYMIHGIDVSRYQQIIAWEEVKAMQVHDIRMGFAFIKATEGVSNVDPQFSRNWKKAKSNDMPRGAYHFFIASRDGKLQAENFIKRVDLSTGDLPPVLDVEQLNGTGKTQLRKEVRKWLETVETHYRVRPIIYTNVDFYKNYLGEEFDDYPLWVAHYYEQRQPRINRDWSFWQHSDKGSVNGIISKVDFNVFAGDSLAFRELLVK